jgi:tetratricopeptide (TPR) repeat protein
MKSTLFLFVLLLSLTLILAQAPAQTTVTEDLMKGNEAFDKFDNEAALKFYQLAYKADTTNCEAVWKIARAHIDLGEIAEKDLQRKHYYDAETMGRKAVALCPNDANAHLQLSIAVGRVALMEGGKKKVELSKEVKVESEKALELDPANDIAHHVLARWNREVANLSGVLKMFAKILYGGLPPASNEQAIEHFKKAVELNPEYINHHLELGITYEEMDNWIAAKGEYEKIPSLPNKDSQDEDHKKEAAERLQKVLKKIK